MMRKISITFFLLLTCCFATCIVFGFSPYEQNQVKEGAPHKNKRPNVVIIMADDLNSTDLSCYGGTNLQTKNIDALANEGMKFNNMICSEAMCVPTRASLFTGLYPARHGSFQNHKKVYDTIAIKSVPHYLGNLGFRVGLTGKNHSTRPRAVFPFEIIEGFEPKCVSQTDDYSLDKIQDFIKTSEDPFCLFVMSINPHAPWTVGDPSEFDPSELKLPPNWVDTPETRSEYAKYLAEVRQLDNQVGDVVQMLKDNGEYDNTIVIFLGEQGSKFPGAKWTLWDQGQRSSMIVKWHEVVNKGTQNEAIVQYEDILPTLIDIAGGEAIDHLDGKTFLPVLTGSSEEHRVFAYGIHNNIPEGPAYPIRSVRTNRYKLIKNLRSNEKYHIKHTMNDNEKGEIWTSWVNEGKESEQARTLYKRVEIRPEIEFYDLKEDPYELNNLAGDSRFTNKISEFENALSKWMQEQGDTGAEMDKKY